jgi:hypothetical protein
MSGGTVAQEMSFPSELRRCICEPIPEVMDAARYLDAAVVAHMQGNANLARQLIRAADMDAIRMWLKAIWADCSKHVQRNSITPKLPDNFRHKQRMPSNAEKAQIHQRDGYNCRFCGMPVIRRETRKRIHEAYPEEAYWAARKLNNTQAFKQCGPSTTMWFPTRMEVQAI